MLFKISINFQIFLMALILISYVIILSRNFMVARSTKSYKSLTTNFLASNYTYRFQKIYPNFKIQKLNRLKN